MTRSETQLYSPSLWSAERSVMSLEHMVAIHERRTGWLATTVRLLTLLAVITAGVVVAAGLTGAV